jgi:hypothetical protein
MSDVATVVTGKVELDMTRLGQHSRATANRIERLALAERVNKMYRDSGRAFMETDGKRSGLYALRSMVAHMEANWMARQLELATLNGAEVWQRQTLM